MANLRELAEKKCFKRNVSLLSFVCVCAPSKEGIIYGAGIIVTIMREVNIFMDFFMAHFNCIQLCLGLLDKNHFHIETKSF